MAILRIFLIFLIFISVANAEPQRIISLAPNVTETLYYLNAGDNIVGVSDYCNWPENVKNKIRVGGMLNPSFEKILFLKPDLIIISQEGTPLEVYQRLLNLGLRVYVFNPKSLLDLPVEILKLAQIIGKYEKAKIFVKNFNEQLKEFKNIFNGQKALFIIWAENLTVAGDKSHIGEIMKILGLKNIANNSYTYIQQNIEDIIKKNPDIIFIGSGHDRNINRGIIEKLRETNAVKNGKVYLISDKIYHLSPRIIDGIREMVNGKNSYNSSRKP
ncbi:MAG: helical backbone metal receptor [Thermodesulfovibrio sp.]|nr:helical backbone metal receptor [Thermodesulfovibrio sp.]